MLLNNQGLQVGPPNEQVLALSGCNLIDTCNSISTIGSDTLDGLQGQAVANCVDVKRNLCNRVVTSIVITSNFIPSCLHPGTYSVRHPPSHVWVQAAPQQGRTEYIGDVVVFVSEEVVEPWGDMLKNPVLCHIGILFDAILDRTTNCQNTRHLAIDGQVLRGDVAVDNLAATNTLPPAALLHLHLCGTIFWTINTVLVHEINSNMQQTITTYQHTKWLQSCGSSGSLSGLLSDWKVQQTPDVSKAKIEPSCIYL